MLILKEMAVWGDVAGVAEMEPRGVPVWTRGWACLRRVVGLRGWGNGRSGLGGGGLGFVGERGGVIKVRSFATLRMTGGVRG